MNTFRTVVRALSLILLLTAWGVQAALAASCESLSALKLPDTTITSAKEVAAGAFIPPGATSTPAAAKKLPAFCRVTAEIKPTTDSNIKIEVWLPLTGWNGKYRGQGNGGFAGQINYQGMGVAIANGYATASTDTGHTGGPVDATWALGHQEKIIDFGYRAIHEMTVKAKAVAQTFYGDAPRRSYFAGCSDGGREALMEAQRYPADYDGIIAGAPANDWVHLLAAAVWNMQATNIDPANYIPASKVPVIAAAVRAACDELDGVKDGILNDPRDCHFDPDVLLCKETREADANCLTGPQITALKKIYSGPQDSKGNSIFAGFSPGGEEGGNGWSSWVTGTSPRRSNQSGFGYGFFANMVFNDPAWDFKTFNFDTGVKIADQKQAASLSAIDPNLKPFKARGGKLIIYHGWSDVAIPPLSTIHYYNSVETKMGARGTEAFVRLFMVPGMQHCGGGPGPSSFGEQGTATDGQHDIYLALEQWVEKGTAPETIIATKYVNDFNPAQGVKMTRPLCPYPQVAKYKGTGDTNDAANFACVAGNK